MGTFLILLDVSLVKWGCRKSNKGGEFEQQAGGCRKFFCFHRFVLLPSEAPEPGTQTRAGGAAAAREERGALAQATLAAAARGAEEEDEQILAANGVPGLV